ncbi:MAG: CotH kinase family protein, partial [Pirellulaceae bacterium]
RSFLVKFSEFEKGRTFLGLQRVALDNGIQFGSLFSEPLITAILRDLEVPASRCNYATLYLNGKFHGVYTNVERLDSAYIKNHFSGSGALYKNHTGGAGGSLEPVRLPLDPNDRRGLAFEPKSSAAHQDARDVLALIEKINKTPDRDFARVMEATLDMDSFLKTMAVMLFSGAFDQLTGWAPHNYYLYHDPADGRWHYLPWDLDVGFADNAFRRVPVIAGWHAAWPIMPRSPSPLIQRILDNPQLLARYRREADLILEKYFHPRVLVPRLDQLYLRIKDDLAADPFPDRRVTNPEDRSYDTIVASMKEFIERRYQIARTQLDHPGPRPPLHRNAPPSPGPQTADAPSELRVVAATARSVMFRWKDNSQKEIGHILQRADGEKGGEFRNLRGQPGQNLTTMSDNKVMPGKTYRYRVYAVQGGPTGPQGMGVSNTVTVQVPGK